MSNDIEHKSFWDSSFEARFKKYLNEPPPKKHKLVDKIKGVIKKVNKKHKDK